eukprot:TRINITY_DN3110_c0_g1_i3.p2 TRINITY_DN3110_c0_g1~~TRINITY_DN3110_c0_g1_i3.p2  ORF type:complete len:205 (-),score=38.61 TRINITY_DN3110_c0_g1_i3:66-680(-)
MNPIWIDFIFPSGIQLGLFKINVNGNILGLKTGKVRPSSFCYFDLYYRTPERSEIPPELIGKWNADKFGYLLVFCPTAFSVTFKADGRYLIEGSINIAPALRVEGQVIFELGREPNCFHLTIEYSNLQMLAPLGHTAGVFKLSGKELLIEFPLSSRGSFTPQIFDNPIPVSYTHLRAHETSLHLVCRLLLEKKKKKQKKQLLKN